jgi:tyrosyl-tRNA synthetase
LCTAMHPSEVKEIEAQVALGGVAANAAKRAVARAIVTLYHGADAADAAEERFDAIHKRGEIPADVAEFALPDTDPVHVPALLVAVGLAASTSAARRDIDAGAVRVDGEVVPARQYDVPRADLAGRVLSSGKRRAARVVWGG